MSQTMKPSSSDSTNDFFLFSNNETSTKAETKMNSEDAPSIYNEHNQRVFTNDPDNHHSMFQNSSAIKEKVAEPSNSSIYPNESIMENNIKQQEISQIIQNPYQNKEQSQSSQIEKPQKNEPQQYINNPIEPPKYVNNPIEPQQYINNPIEPQQYINNPIEPPQYINNPIEPQYQYPPLNQNMSNNNINPNQEIPESYSSGSYKLNDPMDGLFQGMSNPNNFQSGYPFNNYGNFKNFHHFKNQASFYPPNIFPNNHNQQFPKYCPFCNGTGVTQANFKCSCSFNSNRGGGNQNQPVFERFCPQFNNNPNNNYYHSGFFSSR